MRKPFGRGPPPIICPIGSGRAATSRHPSAIAAMRFSSRRRRSNMASLRPRVRPASKSRALAAMISVWRATSCSAIISRARFLTAVPAVRNSEAAAQARCARASTCALVSSGAAWPFWWPLEWVVWVTATSMDLPQLAIFSGCFLFLAITN